VAVIAEELDMQALYRLRPTRTTVVVLVLGASLVASGCGSPGTGSSTPKAYTEAAFNPSNFVDPRGAANPWFPLKPGMQWLREGTTLVGNRRVPNKVVVTITDAVRVINGVKGVGPGRGDRAVRSRALRRRGRGVEGRG